MSTIVLSGEVADIVETQAKAQGYVSEEAFIHEAVKLFLKQQTDLHIDKGIADIEAGRYKTLTRESSQKLVDSLVDKHMQ